MSTNSTWVNDGLGETTGWDKPHGSNGQFIGENGKLYKVVACVLRNTGSGFALIQDTIHNPLNVASVTNDNNGITVNFNFTAAKVVSFVACPDETYVQSGYNFGASVGTSNAVITASKDAKTIGGYVYYDGAAWQVQGGSGNLAVSSFSAGVLTLTHDSMDDLYLVGMLGRAGYDVRGGSMANNQTQVNFYNGATLVTTADSNMKVFVTRHSSSKKVADPTTIALANSNIWCYGIFEI